MQYLGQSCKWQRIQIYVSKLSSCYGNIIHQRRNSALIYFRNCSKLIGNGVKCNLVLLNFSPLSRNGITFCSNHEVKNEAFLQKVITIPFLHVLICYFLHFLCKDFFFFWSWLKECLNRPIWKALNTERNTNQVIGHLKYNTFWICTGKYFESKCKIPMARGLFAASQTFTIRTQTLVFQWC